MLRMLIKHNFKELQGNEHYPASGLVFACNISIRVSSAITCISLKRIRYNAIKR